MNEKSPNSIKPSIQKLPNSTQPRPKLRTTYSTHPRVQRTFLQLVEWKKYRERQRQLSSKTVAEVAHPKIEPQAIQGYIIAPPRQLNRYVAMPVLPITKDLEAEHRRLRDEYGSLFDDITAMLFRHDPIGLDFEDNTDEYDCEARTILPRLKTCHSAEDALTVVHEEFERWFDPDIAGPRERYVAIATDVWALWQQSPLTGAT